MYTGLYQAAASIHFLDWGGGGGGGGQKLEKCKQKSARSARKVAISNFCAPSAPQKLQLCMFSGI